MPKKEDLDALLNLPYYVTDIEAGSFKDQISNQVQNTLATASDDRYQQALNSTRIVHEMSGKGIRIPGFIVPLKFDDEQTITQFFLVPFWTLHICGAPKGTATQPNNFRKLSKVNAKGVVCSLLD